MVDFSYRTIQTSSLQVGRVPPIDFFIQRDGDESPILFLSRSLPYDRRISRNLFENSVNELLIQEDDYPEFVRYLTRNLRSILRDTNIALRNRCAMTYDLSIELMKQVYESNDPERIYQSSKEVLSNIIEVVFANDEAVHHFIALASQDYQLYTHSINVCLYGIALARKILNLSKEEALIRFGPGMLLHDIGKIEIPREILYKPGPLSEEEWAIVHQHTQKGLEIVERFMPVSFETRSMILYHHERLDGSGYPLGLKGEDISPPARICAIVEAFDAINTNRVFQVRKPSFEALQELKKEIPDKLDAEYFFEFVRLFQTK